MQFWNRDNRTEFYLLTWLCPQGPPASCTGSLKTLTNVTGPQRNPLGGPGESVPGDHKKNCDRRRSSVSKSFAGYNRTSRDENHLRDVRCDGFSFSSQSDSQRRGVYPHFSWCGYKRWPPSALISVNLRLNAFAVAFPVAYCLFPIPWLPID